MIKIIIFFVLGLVAGVSAFNFAIKGRLEGKVLAEKIEISTTATPIQTETASPTASPETTETPEPTEEPAPIQTLSPTLTPTPNPQPTFTSSEINSFIERFSGQYGVDSNVLRHIALCESGFNPSSVNGPYWGLYQFSSNTWSNYRRRMGEEVNSDLRLNSEEAVQTAAYVLSIGNTYIWPNCAP